MGGVAGHRGWTTRRAQCGRFRMRLGGLLPPTEPEPELEPELEQAEPRFLAPPALLEHLEKRLQLSSADASAPVQKRFALHPFGRTPAGSGFRVVCGALPKGLLL
jgi:hypothetical protein